MTTLFDILEGIIDASGDMINDRSDVELDLSLDNIEAYAENGMNISLTTKQVERIQAVGMQWVKGVNDGNGEWSRMRGEAERALNDEVEP